MFCSFIPCGMHAPDPTGYLCSVCVNFFFLKKHLIKMISGTTETIFTISPSCGRYLIADY